MSDFLDALSLEEIKEKVADCQTGSFHSVMILDGSPITLDDGNKLYITETIPATFKINYGNMPQVAFRRMVELAWKPAHVFAARHVYEKLKHKEHVAKKALEILEDKERTIARGEKLPEPVTKEKEDKRVRDKECPSIIYCGNGSTTLIFYASYQNCIKSVKGGFEFYEKPIIIRYFIKKPDGTIFEIDAEKDAKIKEAMRKARVTARSVAGKKEGGTTPVYSPRVQNILNIW